MGQLRKDIQTEDKGKRIKGKGWKLEANDIKPGTME